MINQYMGVASHLLSRWYICINPVYWSYEPLILSFVYWCVKLYKWTRGTCRGFSVHSGEDLTGLDSKSLNRQRAPRHVVVALRATPQEEAGPEDAAASAAATLRATTAESTAELTAKQMPPWSAGVLPASWIIKKPFWRWKSYKKGHPLKKAILAILAYFQ